MNISELLKLHSCSGMIEINVGDKYFYKLELPRKMPISTIQNPELEDQTRSQDLFSKQPDMAYFLDNFTKVTERVRKLEDMMISSDELGYLERALLDENSKEDLMVRDGVNSESRALGDFISVLEHHKRLIF